MLPSHRSREFYRLVWPHIATVLRTATFLTHNVADAEDLAQDAMLKALGSLDLLRDEDRVKPWLMTILRHCHTDHIRAGRHRKFSLDEMELDPREQEQSEPPGYATVWQEPEEVWRQFVDEEMIAAL